MNEKQIVKDGMLENPGHYDIHTKQWVNPVEKEEPAPKKVAKKAKKKAKKKK